MADNADHDPVVGSHSELTFLIDRALRARQNRQLNVSIVLARAAEGFLRVDLPDIAADIAKIASRKGQGEVIASRMIPHLTPRAAAAVCVVLMIRGARSPAIKALKDSLGLDPAFDETIRILCRRVFVGDADEAYSRPSRFA